MATREVLEERIRRLDWSGLRSLWTQIRVGTLLDWERGEAMEYLVLRAFELDNSEPIQVRYPYEVSLFDEKVEEIDGAVHLTGLSCLIESKDWGQNVAIAPIAKMRSQLLRRPTGTIGLIFARRDFTTPAVYLAHFTLPQAILLWSGSDLEISLQQERMAWALRQKYRVCCESGIPDYELTSGDFL
jgi:hypothetical protein